MLLDSDQMYHVHRGDSIEHMVDMPDDSVDLSIYSVPFPSMYAYTSEACDVGNSEDLSNEAKLHFSFFFHQFARVVKPGRVTIVHCMQIPRMKRSGEVGLNDFRGMLIRAGERAGLVYEYDWMVRKNPQAQAIRTRSRELQFVGLERDRAKCRGTLCDYLIKFRSPGENEVAIDSSGEVSRQNWIDWAEGSWNDIIETDTLNTAEAKSEDDLKHICPLQLEVIRRCVLLYTNPGEIVFSPYAGIGSEGYMALGGKSPKTGKRITNQRRFYGCELKPEYHAKAIENLEKACSLARQSDHVLLPGFDS